MSDISDSGLLNIMGDAYHRFREDCEERGTPGSVQGICGALVDAMRQHGYVAMKQSDVAKLISNNIELFNAGTDLYHAFGDWIDNGEQQEQMTERERDALTCWHNIKKQYGQESPK